MNHVPLVHHYESLLLVSCTPIVIPPWLTIIETTITKYCIMIISYYKLFITYHWSIITITTYYNSFIITILIFLNHHHSPTIIETTMLITHRYRSPTDASWTDATAPRCVTGGTCASSATDVSSDSRSLERWTERLRCQKATGYWYWLGECGC